MRIRTKLIVLLVVPLVGIILLGGRSLLESNRTASDMKSLQRLSALAVILSKYDEYCRHAGEGRKGERRKCTQP